MPNVSNPLCSNHCARHSLMLLPQTYTQTQIWRHVHSYADKQQCCLKKKSFIMLFYPRYTNGQLFLIFSSSKAS